MTRNTGFARGLFDATETDSGKVKDKESKTAWLAKIIACVGLALNEKVTARPLKIVAGLEPEHTNAFLQQLARAAKTGDSSDAVRRALAGETPAAAPPKQTQRGSVTAAEGTVTATTTTPTRTREVTLARARVRAATAAAQRLRR